MRILIATHYWRPHRGGIETVAFEQACRPVARNHVVTVLTSRLRGDPAMQVEEGFEVRRIRALNPLERRGGPFPIFSPSLWREMTRLVRAHDLVLAHSHSFLTSAAAVTAAYRVGKPSLVQHNTYGTLRHTLRSELPFDSVLSVAWSPGSDRLAVGSIAETAIRIFDAETAVLTSQVGHDMSFVRALDWSPGGDYLASASPSTIRIWNVEGGNLLRAFSDDFGSEYAVAWSRDGCSLAGVVNDFQIRIWGPGAER